MVPIKSIKALSVALASLVLALAAPACNKDQSPAPITQVLPTPTPAPASPTGPTGPTGPKEVAAAAPAAVTGSQVFVVKLPCSDTATTHDVHILAPASAGVASQSEALARLHASADEMRVLGFTCPSDESACAKGAHPSSGTAGAGLTRGAFTFQQGPPPPPIPVGLQGIRSGDLKQGIETAGAVVCNTSNDERTCLNFETKTRDHRIAVAHGLVFYDQMPGRIGRYLFVPCKTVKDDVFPQDISYSEVFEEYAKSPDVVLFSSGRHGKPSSSRPQMHRFLELKLE